MPPTVQTGKRDDRDHRQQRTGEKRSELVCKVKYNNTLPDIPFDPKFITYPFESNRFVEYNPTGLERNYKHELLTEHDLGVVIDLINPETYKIDHNAFLDPEDEKLLEEEVSAPSDSKRSQRHNRSVSWLRKTEYISTEYNRFQQSAEKVEARVGYHIKKKFKEEDLYKDRASQIKAIEHTFDMTKEQITNHYSKAGVTALEVLPVFPDFEMWKHPYAQVIFDSDPTPIGRAGPAHAEEMSQAMIRGMVDESGDQFVAYFIPTEETLKKRKRDEDDNIDFADGEEYDYTLAREYNWNVKNKASKGYEETYFFVFREDGVFYNELETRVRLSKRRKIGNAPVNKSRLIVKHRDPQPEELNTMNARLAYLEPHMEEEEEEEVDIQEDNLQPTESGDEAGREEREGSVRSRSASRSRSRSRSRSGSRSPSRSRSRSRSRSKSRSRSRSRSRSVSRSRSRSRSGSRSTSRSRSRSGSRSGSGSESEDDNKKEADKIFGSDSDSD